jgi:hypothetical protein
MTEFDDIKRFIERMERDSKAIREEMLRICWFMRGSISYEDAMLLSEQDREIINKIISDNMETTKKSGLPFF